MEEKKNKKKGFEFVVKESDVLERENFGSFEIVLTKSGIIFKNYTGYRVFTTPYTTGLDGVAHQTSLYSWLKYVLDMKKSTKGKENELFEGTDVTIKDFMDGLKTITESNLVKPQVVFTDFDEAVRESNHFIEWIDSQTEELKRAMGSTPPEEDLKANAELESRVAMAETLKEITNGTVQTEERQV